MARTDTRLTLTRHGESVAQAEQFLSGHDTCRGLSARGRGQAAALRDRLATTNELGSPDAVFTSVLPRAIETAQILNPVLGGAAPVEECDWCEIHAGDAEGMPWSEFERRYAPDRRDRDPYARRAPGSETWAEFFVRAGARLQRVAAEHPGERVVVVCHGGIVGASFVALGNASIDDGVTLTHETRNASLTEWRHSGRGWRLVRYNDAAHIVAGRPTRR